MEAPRRPSSPVRLPVASHPASSFAENTAGPRVLSAAPRRPGPCLPGRFAAPQSAGRSQASHRRFSRSLAADGSLVLQRRTGARTRGALRRMKGAMLSRRTLFVLPAAAWLQEVEAGFQPMRDWTVVDGPESAFAVEGGNVTVQAHASYPAWLRSAKEYTNFELRGEFLVDGWNDSGIYLHAPMHGYPTDAGIQIKIFHQPEETPGPYSCGSVFPVIAPRKVPVKKGWNDFRILADDPLLRVWINGELVQDLNQRTHPMLRYRLRTGFIGIAGVSCVVRFRNLRVKELPGREDWIVLYERPEDLDRNWRVTVGKVDALASGPVLRIDGDGLLGTKEEFRDFYLQCYIRGCAQHNSGVIFRSAGKGTDPRFSYEIQLHPVPDAHFPTGSLYHIQRARYPRIEDEKWFLFELRVQGRDCMVRINGETVMEYSGLQRTVPGFIELQAHRRGYWVEFRRIRVQEI